MEILVVDDMGDDDTKRLIDRFRSEHLLGDQQLRYVRNEHAPGPSGSRNLGASDASGDILAFLDDDDLWESTYLEHAVDVLARTGRPLLISGEKLLKRGPPSDWRIMPEDVSLDELFYRNPGVHGSNIVVDREAFLGLGGFDEQLPRTEDKDLVFRFLLSGRRYAVLEETCVVYRSHDGQRLTKNPKLRWPYYRKHRGRVSIAARRRLRGDILREEYRQAQTTTERGLILLRMFPSHPLRTMGWALGRLVRVGATGPGSMGL